MKTLENIYFSSLVQDLSSTLSELLQLVKSQQTQILSLRQEVNAYQTHNRQTISDLVRGEVEKLEDTILERVNGGLAEHSVEESILDAFISCYFSCARF